MQIDKVRHALQQLVSGPMGSISGLATAMQVAPMTVRRFLNHETDQVNAEAWAKMVAYVAALDAPTEQEARGILRALARMRRELDAIEREAVAVLGGESDEDAVGRVLDAIATPPEPAALPASVPRARRRVKG
jgi:phosphoenolpyruvate synthase/pyruvate phosphate dikinase